ncbi:MAG: hypothetical protein IPK82_19690 [Polyangiaceae bacterium]|nr:hypothetical protein [Polyangiaceae bacterium]
MARKGLWLGVFVALLALSAWLMSRGDKEKSTVRPPKVEFPRNATPDESVRNQKRRTLPPLPSPNNNDEGFRMRRDPMLVALPVDKKRSAMVFEVEALKETPIAQIWLDCLLERTDRQGDASGLERFKERFGIDPLEDVERVAVSSERLAIMQGSFSGATFDPSVWNKRTYGEKGVIYENPESGRTIAMWGGDMMLMSGVSDSAEAVEDAIDRLESTDPNQKSILNETNAYGDIYGVLSPEDLAKMLPEEQDALAEKVQQVVDGISVHVDASEDVAIVADVNGPGGQDLEDLSRSFGAALAASRFKAKNDGNEELANLLDYAKVKQPAGGHFALDVALPIDVLKTLGPCRKSSPPSAATAEPKNTSK